MRAMEILESYNICIYDLLFIFTFDDVFDTCVIIYLREDPGFCSFKTLNSIRFIPILVRESDGYARYLISF